MAAVTSPCFCCCLFVCCQGNIKKQLSWNWKVLLSRRKKRTYYNLVQTEWQYVCYFNFKIISVIWATWELISSHLLGTPGSWEGTEVKGQSLGVCNNVSVWWNPNELFVDLILATGEQVNIVWCVSGYSYLLVWNSLYFICTFITICV